MLDIIKIVVVLLLYLVGFVAILALSFTAVFMCNEYTKEKVNYEFINIKSFGVAMLAAPAVVFGYQFITEKNDPFGIGLMAFGILVSIAFYWYNIRKTNLAYGLIGSTIFLVVFGAVSFFAWVFLVLIVFSALYFLLGTKPVVVINGRK